MLALGSFTGIRIGISSVKAISESLTIPIADVSSLEALAYNSCDNTVCTLIDAKNDNVYTGFFENSEGKYILKNELSIKTIDQLISELKDLNLNITFIGDGASVYKENIYQNIPNSKFIDNNNLSAYNLGIAGLNHYLDGECDDLLPLYLRKPQAQRNLEGE